MSGNTVVPPGISGRSAQYNSESVTLETLTNETALLNLGNVVPLNIKIDCAAFMSEIQEFNKDWVDYLPRTDRPNNRKALSITNLPGIDHKTNISLAEASYAAKKRLSELDFNSPTEVYKKCSSLHNFLDQWRPLGRTFLVKSNVGGYFVPHRDHPSMPRDVFRLIVFLNNCNPLDYDWLMDDRKMQIEMGRVYYINTRLTHRTMSWVDDSMHLILNVPFNSENVAKVVANLQHTH
jgi:hypothetical protein